MDLETIADPHQATHFEGRRKLEVMKGNGATAGQFRYAVTRTAGGIVDLKQLAGAGQLDLHPTLDGLGLIGKGGQFFEIDKTDGQLRIPAGLQGLFKLVGHKT